MTADPDPRFDQLPEPLRDPARRHWEHALPGAGAALAARPDLALELARVWALSPFVARTCAGDPALLPELVRSGDLERDYPEQTYREGLAGAAQAGDEAELMRLLRTVRSREAVRIAWRDIAGRATLETTMGELSRLADAAMDSAIDWLAERLAHRLGMPLDDTGRPQRLVVIAMGKLGAHELNFSSDIDLMFAYPADGQTAGGSRSLSNQEFFDRLGQRLIAVLSQITADGQVFRVDMRLRPFGDSGPLTMSFPALLGYFEAHARDWERYALIKARAAAGDVAAGQSLLEQLVPFVFRRYLDFGALEALRDMKRLITEEIARQGLDDDIKLGAGGIREIEFIGQAFQLIRGGREPALRARSILAVLASLAELRLLPAEACAELADAYRFLRLTENRLQQIDDRQTHRQPADGADRLRVALGMGCSDWDGFAAMLTKHRDRVAMHFERLLDDGNETGDDTLAQVLDEAQDKAQVAAALAAAGLPEAEALAGGLARLREMARVRRLGRNGRQRLARLLPKLLRAVSRSERALTTLDRIATLIDAVAQRSVYLALLADNTSVLDQLVRLCSASPWIAAQIARQPILLDELIDPRVLYTPPDRERLQRELETALARHDSGTDLEGAMDTLRQFRNAQVLRVAAADVSASLPLAEVSNHLSDIAEVVVGAALRRARAHLVARHGRPCCSEDGGRREAGFAVVAYGKLGGLELGYGSDLDLVFLHDSRGAEQVTDGERPIDNSVFFTRLAQRLVHWLQTMTAAGRAYEVDLRLRPSGESGLLVSSLEAFQRYQHEQAWNWEHQALVRARAVAGDERVCAAFEAARRAVLSLPREAGVLREEVVRMRERMHAELAVRDGGVFDLKHGDGGITDIEFMVQYAVLRWASRHPELLAWTDNLRLLETIRECRLLDGADCSTLHDAYFAYRAQVHRLALQERPALVDGDAFGEQRRGVMAVWKRVMQQ